MFITANTSVKFQFYFEIGQFITKQTRKNTLIMTAHRNCFLWKYFVYFQLAVIHTLRNIALCVIKVTFKADYNQKEFVCLYMSISDFHWLQKLWFSLQIDLCCWFFF